MAVSQNNISAKQNSMARRKCDFQQQSGVEQMVGLTDVLQIITQNKGVQRSASGTFQPGLMASSGVSAGSLHQVASDGPMLWLCMSAPQLLGCAYESLHPFLSAHQGRGIEETAPMKAEAQL